MSLDYQAYLVLPEGVSRCRIRGVLKKYDMWNVRLDGRHMGKRIAVEGVGTGRANAWNNAVANYRKDMERLEKKYGGANEQV